MTSLLSVLSVHLMDGNF